ncbi:MAG: hypothetical protein U0166_29210 [Acidobacteriota bacterium]
MDNPASVVGTRSVLEETAFGAREPFIWSRATVFVSMTIFPEDGHEHGRQVLIGAWTHRDPPLVRMVRRAELRGLPPVMAELLAAVKASLPERERLASERQRVAAEKTAKEEQDRRDRQQKAAAPKANVRKSSARKPAAKTPGPQVDEAIEEEDDDDGQDAASAATQATTGSVATEAAPPASTATQASLFSKEV